MTEQERFEEIWPNENTPVDALLFEQGALMKAVKEALERHVGCTDARLRTLGALVMLGEISQTELQHHLDVDGAAVTRQVKQLEAEGLLTRRVDPADNRFTLVTLTPEGKEWMRAVARKVREFATLSLDGISAEDMACMRRIMARVRANMETL